MTHSFSGKVCRISLFAPLQDGSHRFGGRLVALFSIRTLKGACTVYQTGCCSPWNCSLCSLVFCWWTIEYCIRRHSWMQSTRLYSYFITTASIYQLLLKLHLKSPVFCSKLVARWVSVYLPAMRVLKELFKKSQRSLRKSWDLSFLKKFWAGKYTAPARCNKQSLLGYTWVLIGIGHMSTYVRHIEWHTAVKHCCDAP